LLLLLILKGIEIKVEVVVVVVVVAVRGVHEDGGEVVLIWCDNVGGVMGEIRYPPFILHEVGGEGTGDEEPLGSHIQGHGGSSSSSGGGGGWTTTTTTSPDAWWW